MVTLWHASGTEVPTTLLAALSGAKGKPDGVRIKIVRDPFMALATLCRQRAEEKARAEGEGSTAARLVMVFPEVLTDAAELCMTADTYAPGVPRWQYGPAANPTLRPIVDEDVARWAAKSAPQVVVTPAASARGSRTGTVGGQPQLRLAGEGPLGGSAGTGGLDNRGEPADGDDDARLAGDPPSAPTPRSEPLITDEELRMLLGENNEEGGER
jgi:hypothetical protein